MSAVATFFQKGVMYRELAISPPDGVLALAHRVQTGALIAGVSAMDWFLSFQCWNQTPTFCIACDGDLCGIDQASTLLMVGPEGQKMIGEPFNVLALALCRRCGADHTHEENTTTLRRLLREAFPEITSGPAEPAPNARLN